MKVQGKIMEVQDRRSRVQTLKLLMTRIVLAG